MIKLTRNDKIVLLAKFKQAVKAMCEKHDVPTWPIAISIDLPNACIKTGCLDEKLGMTEIELKENEMIDITCDKKYWNKCTKNKLFMDDYYTFKLIKPRTEITLGCGKVTMFCLEVINEQTIKCKIIQGGLISDMEFLCVRGIKHIKPPLSKYDLSMIEFAKEFSVKCLGSNK
ncbi:unnamed protein product [Parnassius mnemosyne]|uniref:Pyruvate kinase barrel domain-containing protein n=1 Tax=Parnassius mnemosyne TaxID=213953 RepID=A0AAV1LVM9_9NEOP